MNESAPPKDDPSDEEKRGAFEHVRKREFEPTDYKTKDVDQARRALLFQLAARTSIAGGAGVLMGLAADMKSEGPVPWTLVLPFVLWFLAFVSGYLLMEGGGKFASTLHNPSGRSTPPEKQYSAAQALVVRGHYEDAVTAYEVAISQDDSDPAPYVQIARILRDHLNRYEDAAVWFKRVQRHPNAHGGTALLAIRELTELYANKLDDPSGVMPLLAQLSETRPDSPEGEWAARELAELRAARLLESPE